VGHPSLWTAPVSPQTLRMTGAIPRETIIVVYDGVVLLDVAGPLQVLHSASGYRIRLASSDGSAVTTNVGTPLGAHMALPQLDGSVHTLIVPGYAPGGPRPGKDVVDHVRRAGSRATRVASVCTGAFLLAEAGLLVGRRATTHWAVCDELAGRFPEVAVQPDAIYVRDGKVVTSAGMTAGIDLALALVDEDLGPDTARAIARWMVVFLQRPGGQSQFSVRATTGTPRNAALRRVLDAVAADPAGDHSMAAMAGVAAVSPRHLSRLFRRELRSTPAEYVERVRVEAAQALLEAADTDMEAVARRCGFGTGETLRRTFLKVLGTTPGAYRQRFRTPRRQQSPA
jgi:transcriptional regulator GlxA family with amidase domain